MEQFSLYTLESRLEIPESFIETVVQRAATAFSPLPNYRSLHCNPPLLRFYDAEKVGQLWNTSLIYGYDERLSDILFLSLGDIADISSSQRVNIAKCAYDLTFMIETRDYDPEHTNTLFGAINFLKSKNFHLSCTPVAKEIVQLPACTTYKYLAEVTGPLLEVIASDFSCDVPHFRLEKKNISFSYDSRF